MAVKMRLTRLGDKRTPFYRIVVADSRVARDAKYIDLVGTYNPLTKPEEIKIDAKKAERWIWDGAQPTPTVSALLKKAGVEIGKRPVEEKKAEKKPAKKAAPKKETAEKAPAKKPAAKKEAAEKEPAKKTTTRKTAAKKAE